jgi:glycosyltransferase involved in cell wall biosynthesis
MILVDAAYINQSGGKILLEYLIETVIHKGLENDFFFILDERLRTKYINKLPAEFMVIISASEYERRKFYKKMPFQFTTVFCFANVPPPYVIAEQRVFILFHNALILGSIHARYNLISNIKFLLKRIYIKIKSSKKYTWIVQTNNMSYLIKDKLGIKRDAIKILPIYDVSRFAGLNLQLEINKKNFLYVADGVKQKNHDLLLQAWEIVFDRVHLPVTLHLTIPPQFVTLIAEIDRLRAKGISIINHGFCSLSELQNLYCICNYFITPSLAESFGLPIIEAATAGCEILAADLEYVYDVVKPMVTFDVHDPEDLANCIISTFEGRNTGKTKIIIENKIENLLSLLYNV